MPIYFNKVLNVPIGRTGLSAMILPVSQLVVKLILGVAADHVDCFNVSYSYIRSKTLLYQRGYGVSVMELFLPGELEIIFIPSGGIGNYSVLSQHS
ncbi:hypothetical protein WUBG_18188 [Wuchereria bancrofti]|uniref:Uncharacterized protein n=1 Tax=Wuchereria bancrofti TaxID=6293 RepID=J9DN38_WUCBA|nr:hypothetical protein WUBG_18188 [Wuchereria bancrofti]